MGEELTFKPETHEYFLGGRLVPGTTGIINAIAPQREVGDWYLNRGSAVHAAVALALRDDLDPDSVDERIAGRVQSVLAFLRAEGLMQLACEMPLASRRYQFAGTVDYLGTRAKDCARVLCDWKGSLSPQVEVQMGAYSLLLAESSLKGCDTAVAVETHDDGSFKCRWFTKAELKRAQQTFLAFLTAANWKAANKLGGKESK
jgi:hypothetical protein